MAYPVVLQNKLSNRRKSWRAGRLLSTSLLTGNQQVDAIHVTQLERDTVLVCLDRKCLHTVHKLYQPALLLVAASLRHFFTFVIWFNSDWPTRWGEYTHTYSTTIIIFLSPENVKIVNLLGRLKSNKKLASELSFDFCIEAVGKISERH